MRKADVEAGIKPGTTSAESRELREAKRRVRLLEQENEVLRRAAAYLSQANLPGKGGTARERARRGRHRCHGGVPGTWNSSPALLPVAQEPGHRDRIGRGVPGQRPVRRTPRRPRIRIPLPGRRSRGRGREDVPADCLADLLCRRLDQRHQQEGPGSAPQSWPSGSRRPRRAGLHRPGPERAVANRHHRALDGRGEAVFVRDQGRLFGADRRLFDRLENEVPPGGQRVEQRCRQAGRGDRLHPPQR